MGSSTTSSPTRTRCASGVALVVQRGLAAGGGWTTSRWNANHLHLHCRAQSHRQVPMEQAVLDGVAGTLIEAMRPQLEPIFAAGWSAYGGVFVPQEDNEDPYHQGP